jgi:hypothetical protein
MAENSAFDQAPDQAELLGYLMFRQGSPQRREVALENLRSLNTFGLAQLRSEMRARAREEQRAGHADLYSPWDAD